MNEDIIIAIITVIGSIVTSIIGSNAVVDWRLKALEKKVDEHDKYEQMLYQQHEDIAILQKSEQYIRGAIDKIKAKQNKE